MAVTMASRRSVQEEADDVLHAVMATAEGHADPYPHYDRLRRLAPVHHSALDGVWYVTDFDTCRQLLGDARMGKNDQIVVRRHGVDEARVKLAERRGRPTMLTTNPPDHSRLRGVAKGAFIPPSMEALRPRVAALVDERLDRLADLGEADVMAELAYPLPVTVISELVGVPVADRDWFNPIMRTLISSDQPNPTAEETKKVERAGDELDVYFRDLIAARQARPQDDLLSALVARHEAGELTYDELRGTITLVFIAGFLTTTNLIGNGLLAFFRHPDQLARLLADPALVAPAVEEILRYDTPVQMVHRRVVDDIEIGGHRLRPDDIVFTILAAANRDPARFPRPDRFDIARADNLHLAFAWGLHFCLGARLARMEGQLVFAGLRERFSNIEPAGEPVRRPGLAIRALDSLPVRVTLR
jgi:cytochrome P450